MFYKIHNVLKKALSKKLNDINLMFEINTSYRLMISINTPQIDRQKSLNIRCTGKRKKMLTFYRPISTFKPFVLSFLI